MIISEGRTYVWAKTHHNVRILSERTRKGDIMSDTMTKRDVIVELLKSMTPEQRRQILTEDFREEFEREVLEEYDKRMRKAWAEMGVNYDAPTDETSDQAGDAADQGE